MIVVLKHDIYPIKCGYAASSPELHLTAHGCSPELAKSNLEATISAFFKPFERQGELNKVFKSLKLPMEEQTEPKLTIHLN